MKISQPAVTDSNQPATIRPEHDAKLLTTECHIDRSPMAQRYLVDK